MAYYEAGKEEGVVRAVGIFILSLILMGSLAGAGSTITTKGLRAGSDSLGTADVNSPSMQATPMNHSQLPAGQFGGATPGNFGGASDVAVGADGDIYVTDFENQRVQIFDHSWNFIRQLDTNLSRTAGFNPYGVAVSDKNGTVYVVGSLTLSSYNGGVVAEFSTTGTLIRIWGTSQTGGYYYSGEAPHFVAVDSQGFVYVSDDGPDGIRKFNASGALVSTIGSGGGGVRNHGVAISGGYLYVARTSNVYQCVLSSGAGSSCIFQKFFLNGTLASQWGSNTQLGAATGIAVDRAGNVYFTDSDSVVEYSGSGTPISTFGSKGQKDGEFYSPSGLCIDSGGILYVADFINDRVQRFAPGFAFIGAFGKPTFYAVGGEGGHSEFGIDALNRSAIYVTDKGPGGYRISVINSTGYLLYTSLLPITGTNMRDLAVNPLNESIYVIALTGLGNCAYGTIEEFSANGTLLHSSGVSGCGSYQGIGIDGNGYVYTVDGPTLYKFDASLKEVKNSSVESYGLGYGLDRPIEAKVSASGNLYAIYYRNSAYSLFVADSTLALKYNVTAPAGFTFAGPLATDPYGDVYVAATSNTILAYNGFLQYLDLNAGPGQLMAMTFGQGSLYVASIPNGQAGLSLPVTLSYFTDTALPPGPNLSFAVSGIQVIGPPMFYPDRPVREALRITNFGNVLADFVYALAIPPYLNVTGVSAASSVEGVQANMTILEETHSVDYIHLRLSPFVPVYVTFTDILPTSATNFGRLPNPPVTIFDYYTPVEGVQVAMLPTQAWQSLSASSTTPDALITSAINESISYERKFFLGLDGTPLNGLQTATDQLSISNPYLALYIAHTLYERTLEDQTATLAVGGSNQTLSGVSYTPAALVETQTGPSQDSTSFFKNFFNSVEFAKTEDTSLCGMALGAVQTLTGGIVRFEGNNEYFKIGKITGEVGTVLETVVVSSGGPVAADLRLMTPSTTGIAQPAYGVEWFDEASGTYGTVFKAGFNYERSRFPYVGFGTTRLLGGATKEVSTATGTKQVFGTLFHLYANTKAVVFNPITRGFREIPIWVWGPLGGFGYWLTRNHHFTFTPSCAQDPVFADSGKPEDPNFLVSSPRSYVRGGSPVDFSLHFENEANATGPAHNAIADIFLDPNFNISSVMLIGTDHPADLNFSLYPSRNEIVARFDGISLPPDTSPPAGEAFVEFSVLPNSGIPEGTALHTYGQVYFDLNPPVRTGTSDLVLDDSPPTSNAHFSIVNSTEVRIYGWTNDTGSGTDLVTVTVSPSGGNATGFIIRPNEVLKTGNTIASNYSLKIETRPGTEYSMYAAGIDLAGNQEVKSTADANFTTPVSSTGSATSQSASQTGAGGGVSSSPFIIAATVAAVALVIPLLALVIRRRNKT